MKNLTELGQIVEHFVHFDLVVGIVQVGFVGKIAKEGFAGKDVVGGIDTGLVGNLELPDDRNYFPLWKYATLE